VRLALRTNYTCLQTPALSRHLRLVSAAATMLAIATGVLLSGPAEAASPYEYVFPVVGHAGYAHRHSGYPASDIIANCGLPVVSAVDGVVLEVSRVDRWSRGVRNGSTRGGKFVSIRGDDGVRYYGSHLSVVKGGIRAGVRVAAGQKIGEVGRTGRAGACHLHFGISPVCAGKGDWWIRRGTIWPWPYLDSWRNSDVSAHRSPAREVRGWKRAHGCPPVP
jgi:murein DD-endopeptidase MepM/ murein hydrolase activator NlpD